MQAQSIAATAVLAESMGTAAAALSKVNAAASVQTTQKAMQDFIRQQEIAGLSEEMVDDALADAFDEPGTEAEADHLVTQVLAEVGVQATSGLVAAPDARLPQAEQEKQGEGEISDAELRRLLASL
eukprot:scaffold991_cov227-Pinguiococcus_pyrenoidosus.AAC.13